MDKMESMSLHDMYGDLNNIELRERVKRDFGKGGAPKRMLPCGRDAQGKFNPLDVKIIRHPLNKRKYASLRKHYANIMLEKGYIAEDAGLIWLVDVGTGPLLAVGGATRCEAFITAATLEPDNRQLHIFADTGGFEALIVSDLPTCVITYLVEDLNSKNSLGANNTLMQKIENVPMYFKRWEDHVLKVNDESDGPAKLSVNDEQKQYEFIQQATPMYESGAVWIKARQFYNAVNGEYVNGEKQTLLAAMSEYFDNHADILAMQAVD